jgi:hypothetical protein
MNQLNAMRQALEALKNVKPYLGSFYTVAHTSKLVSEAVLALRQAIEQDEQADKEAGFEMWWGEFMPSAFRDRAWEAWTMAHPTAPAQPLITHEQHIALREAFAIGAADSYFEAHPTHNNDVGRMLFERGFARGFDSHERAIKGASR